MANPTTLGYLITVDTTGSSVTIVNHSTLKAIGVVQNTAVANVLTFVIPSGVKLDYNGIADGTTTPGSMTQEILCTSGGIALYWTLVARLNNYMTCVFSPLSGADLTNSGTRLVEVLDITPNKVKRDGDVHLRVTIEIIGSWA